MIVIWLVYVVLTMCLLVTQQIYTVHMGNVVTNKKLAKSIFLDFFSYVKGRKKSGILVKFAL